MYNFVLQIIVFSSLGLVIFLLARALPRIDDGAAPNRRLHIAVDKWLAKIPTAKIDASINSFLAKFLRKIKVVIMKVDNFINHRLGKLSKKVGNGNGDKTDQLL